MKANEAYRRFKDPAGLTPYEQKIHEMHQSGASPGEIASAINSKENTIKQKLRAIREKVVLHEFSIKQDRYGAFR